MSQATFWSKHVSVKYQALLTPAIALIFAVFGWYMYRLEMREAAWENTEMAEFITRQTNQALINWIQDQIRLAHSIAEDPRIIALCLQPTNANVRAEAQTYLNAMKERYPNNENIPVAIHLDGKPSFDLQVGDRLVPINNGNFIMDAVEGKTIGKCCMNFNYVRQVFSGKPYFISDVYPSILRGNPIFVIAVPVHHDGQIVGLALVAPRMDAFTQTFVDRSRLGRTGYLTMIDERGMIIAHPDGELILNTNAIAKVSDIMTHIKQGQTDFVSSFDGRVKKYHVARFSSDEFNIEYTWYIIFGREVEEMEENANDLMNRLVWCMVILLAAVSFLTSLFSHLLIARPLGRLTEAAHRVADGDLTQPLAARDRHDEIGVLCRAINGMTANLQRQTRQIQDALGLLDQSAGQITSASRQQEDLMREHGATTNAVAAAVTEITATSRELAATMQDVQRRSESTAALADHGRAGLSEMEASMEQLNQARTSISDKLTHINAKAGNIGEVVTTIAKVAEQTNILSLNASIEAERAGEYGRGFAVVAREIQRLADQTAVATLDIGRTVREMQGAVTSGVMEMDKFSQEVRQSIIQVGQINGRLLQIIENVRELAPRFIQVSEGMQAQAEGADHISGAMNQLSESSRQTGSSLDQMRAAIEQLHVAASDLKQEISRFKT